MSKGTKRTRPGGAARACAGVHETWKAVVEVEAGDTSPKLIVLQKKGEAESKKDGTIFIPEGDMIYITKVTPQHNSEHPPQLGVEWWFEAKTSNLDLEWPEGTEANKIPLKMAIEGMKHVRFCCRTTRSSWGSKKRRLKLAFDIEISRHKTRQLKEAGLGLNRSDRWLLKQIIK
jgi:hypothetical protein